MTGSVRQAPVNDKPPLPSDNQTTATLAKTVVSSRSDTCDSPSTRSSACTCSSIANSPCTCTCSCSASHSPSCSFSLCADLHLHGHAVRALIDTGSSRSLISCKTWSAIQAKSSSTLTLNPPPSVLSLCTVNGQRLRLRSQVTLDVVVQDFCSSHSFLVVDDLSTCSVILGVDFLSKQDAVIDLKKNKLTLGGIDISIAVESTSPSISLVPVATTVTNATDTCSSPPFSTDASSTPSAAVDRLDSSASHTCSSKDTHSASRLVSSFHCYRSSKP